jgi:hypothetical protein
MIDGSFRPGTRSRTRKLPNARSCAHTASGVRAAFSRVGREHGDCRDGNRGHHADYAGTSHAVHLRLRAASDHRGAIRHGVFDVLDQGAKSLEAERRAIANFGHPHLNAAQFGVRFIHSLGRTCSPNNSTVRTGSIKPPFEDRAGDPDLCLAHVDSAAQGPG